MDVKGKIQSIVCDYRVYKEVSVFEKRNLALNLKVFKTKSTQEKVKNTPDWSSDKPLNKI